MAYIINDQDCDAVLGNTGVPSCPIELGLIDGGFLCDPTFSLTPSEILAIKTNLQAATLLTAKSRIYPLPAFEEMTDQSEEPVEETLGYGSKQIIKEGKQVRLFRFLKGGLCLLKNLRTFNSKEIGIIYTATGVDGSRQYIGTLDSSGNMRPFTLNQFYTYPVKLADGKTGNQYRMKISEQTPSEWDSYAVVTVDFDPKAEVKGILDLLLTAAAEVDNTVDVTVNTKCDLLNTYDNLGALLADPAAWVLTKIDTGVITTITSVEQVPGTKAFTVTGGGAAGDYYLTLASAVALAVLGIGGGNSYGYEASNILTVTLTPGS